MQGQTSTPTTLRQYLSMLQQQGADEMGMKSRMKAILNGALQGDPRALEMSARLGLTKTLGAHDELFLLADKLFPEKSPHEAQAAVGKMLLYDAMGGPQREAKMMDVAKGMAPYFNNDLQRSKAYVDAIYNGERPSEIPGMSFEQFKDITDLTGKLQQQFPTSGALPQLAATFLMAGKTQDAQRIVAAIAEHFPTSGAMEAYQKDRAFNFDVTKHQDMMRIDWARYNQAKSQFDQQYALNQLQYLQGKAREEFDSFWKLYSDKDASQAQKNEATRGLVDALQKQGVSVSSKNVGSLMHPFLGRQEITIPTDTGAAAMAGKPPKNPFTGEDDPQYANGLWDYLKSFGGDVWKYYFNPSPQQGK